MKATLFDDFPIVLDKVLASKIGLQEALVLQQVHYWIMINKRQGRNFQDGRYWTYNTLETWHKETFYFWSIDTVKRTFKKLEKSKILISGNFNKKKFDRTKWYSIDYDVLYRTLGQNAPMSVSNTSNSENDKKEPSNTDENSLGQVAPMQQGNMQPTIPKTSQRLTKSIYSANEDTEEFKKLWSLYPKKKGKAIARKKVPSLLEAYGFEQLERCVKRYVDEITKNKVEDKFISMGSTFFNGKFEDYLDENFEDINNAATTDKPKSTPLRIVID